MTPLVLIVLALAAGCAIGSAADAGPVVSWWLATAGAAVLIVSARFGVAGHAGAGVIAGLPAAIVLGLGLGGAAESGAWTPPGLDLEAVERRVAAGAPVRLRGTVRRDGWRTDTGGVAFDLDVDAIDMPEARPTRLGVRVTVGGVEAASRLDRWTRGAAVALPVSAFRRPQPYRNFDVPDPERALARQGLRAFATAKSARLVIEARGRWWARASAAARAHVRVAVRRHVTDAVAAAIVTAILIGDRSGLAPADERRLQAAGVYHVVAISGGNVAAFLALLLAVPHVAGVAGAWRVAVPAAGLFAFAAVVEGGASVARAVFVAGVALAARWWDLRIAGAQALAVAAGVLLLVHPLAVHDPGALLSFGAASALLWLAGWHRGARDRPSRLARVRLALLLPLAATLVVEAVLMPLSARWFGMVTGAGLLANLLAVPAMLVVQVAGLALVGLALVSTAASDACGMVATGAVRALLASGDVVRAAPWLVKDVPPPSTAAFGLYYGTLFTAAAVAARVRHSAPARAASARAGPRRVAAGRLAAVVVASGAVGTLAWLISGSGGTRAPSPWTWPAANPWQRASWPAEPWLVVTVLDVGQGDATVVRFPSGRTWLVDAGGTAGEAFDLGERVTSRALWALGHRDLARAVITHAHPDHAAGMPAVLRRQPVRELVTGIDVPGDPAGRALVDAARAVGAGLVSSAAVQPSHCTSSSQWPRFRRARTT
jgi:competence protein ComEC